MASTPRELAICDRYHLVETIKDIGHRCDLSHLPSLAHQGLLSPWVRSLLIKHAIGAKSQKSNIISTFVEDVLSYGFIPAHELLDYMNTVKYKGVFESSYQMARLWAENLHLPIILICGYARMGKDSLLTTLQGSSLYQYDIYTMDISCSDDEHELIRHPILSMPAHLYHRVALADELKIQVGRLFRMSACDLDAVKDKPLCHPYMFQVTQPYFPTYRSVLIDHATEMRQRDPDHWSRTALNTHFRPDAINVVTDFRHPNELEFFRREAQGRQVITLRIHRPHTAIPDADIESEHGLDSHEPDLFLVPRGTDVSQLYRNYPYLTNYRRTYTL